MPDVKEFDTIRAVWACINPFLEEYNLPWGEEEKWYDEGNPIKMIEMENGSIYVCIYVYRMNMPISAVLMMEKTLEEKFDIFRKSSKRGLLQFFIKPKKA